MKQYDGVIMYMARASERIGPDRSVARPLLRMMAAGALAAFLALILGQVLCPSKALGSSSPGSASPTMGGTTEKGKDGDRPPEVLSWRHQVLNRDAYVDLAKRWEAYVAAHPKDARAWVDWGQALRYSGEYEESMKKYAQAFAVDSNDVRVIEAQWHLTTKEDTEGSWKRAYQRFLRAMKLDPSYPGIYYGLWNTAIRLGNEEIANLSLRRMVELGDMPAPLRDFGYNLVEGAPRNAIILTNGDNDTYPPLAHQVLSGRRPDVSIVNLSLLNLPWYVRYWKSKGLPISLDDSAIESLKKTDPKGSISDAIQRNLFETLEKKGMPRPLYYSVTVYSDRRVLAAKLLGEGLLWRIIPDPNVTNCGVEESDCARTRELFDTVYRLDSITDPYLDWERESAVAMLSRNYSVLLRKLGECIIGSGGGDAAEPYLYRAAEITTFHHHDDLTKELLEYWKEKLPQGRLLRSAEALAQSR